MLGKLQIVHGFRITVTAFPAAKPALDPDFQDQHAWAVDQRARQRHI